jgi:hypothetical protein
VKLLIDPLLQPHFLDRFDVARPRPEREPVERVQDLLILAELFLKLAEVGRGGHRRFLAAAGRKAGGA